MDIDTTRVERPTIDFEDGFTIENIAQMIMYIDYCEAEIDRMYTINEKQRDLLHKRAVEHQKDTFKYIDEIFEIQQTLDHTESMLKHHFADKERLHRERNYLIEHIANMKIPVQH